MKIIVYKQEKLEISPQFLNLDFKGLNYPSSLITSSSIVTSSIPPSTPA